MSLESVGTGVIVDASTDFSVIRVTINNTDIKFTFSKKVLYIFGIKCEGHMNNILEPGMIVNVLYKFGPNQNPFITAVWLGNKPDNFEEDADSLKPVFDQPGRLTEVEDDHFIVKSDEFGDVLVKKTVVYRDGRLLNEKTGPVVRVGESITFDAVSDRELDVDLLVSHLPEYTATCAWLGVQKPRLVDRFRLAAADQVDDNSERDLEFEGGYFQGIVSVVPNDIVAFVDVDLDGVVEKVLLFRSCFRSDDSSQSLKDLVAGDVLSLRIQRGFIYSGRKQWFAIEACKLGDEISVGESETSGISVGDDPCDVEIAYPNKFDGPSDGIAYPITFDGPSDVGIAYPIKFDEPSDDGIAYPITFDEPSDVGIAYPIKFDEPSDVEIAYPIKFDEPSDVEIAYPNKLDEPIDRITVNKSLYTESNKTLFGSPPLCGTISQLSSGSAIICFRNLKIHVDMSDVYIDGSLCTRDQFIELVSSGNREVNFEAVQSPFDIKQKYGTTHTAIRVWVGKKPSLSVIASGLDPPNYSLLAHKDQKFIGTVTKFCLPKLAFIRLAEKKTTACLHVTQFSKTFKDFLSSEIITDFVKLGDCLEFKMERCGVFLGAVHCKVVNENARKTSKELKKTSTGVSTSEKSSAVLKVLNSYSSESNTNGGRSFNVDKPVQNGLSNPEVFPFEIEHIFNGQYWLLHCKGTLKRVYVRKQNGDELSVYFKVHHELGSSTLFDAPVVYGANDNKPITSEFTNVAICFDAKVIDDTGEKLLFHVERIWIEGKDRQSPETFLIKKLTREGAKELSSSELYRGTISSIPLYDCAVALVKGIPVLVPIQSLVTSTGEMINGSCTTMDTFLSVGDEVVLYPRVLTLEGKLSCCKAHKCWAVKKKAVKIKKFKSSFSSTSTNALMIDSWYSQEYYAKGVVKREGTMYCVDFAHPKRRKKLQTFSLDVFASYKVFVDGKFIGLSEAHVLEGREISYYVAYSFEKEKKGIAPFGLYVAYAWAGNGPFPWGALDGRLSVPKGVLRSNGMFEAVVECLPLTCNKRGVPHHALCSIGPLPIVVPYSADTKPQITCSVGDRVCLRIQEKADGGETFLISNDIQEMRSFTNVLIFKGKVATSPDPVGIIKTVDNVEVCFELCHVKDKATFGCDRTELSDWFKRVSEATYVGATVYFTAVRIGGKTAPYRALHVWVEMMKHF